MFISLGLVGLNGCAGSNGAARNLSDEAKRLAAANNTFAFELYAQLKGASQNLFFSPYSISECLAMSYAGARGNTGKQMGQVLHFGPNGVHSAFGELRHGLKQAAGRKGIELDVANGIWVQTNQALLPAYVDIVRHDYEAELRQVDFATDAGPVAKQINDWATAKTRGKIGDMVPPGLLDRMSRLVLVNAIFFKGTWNTKFNPELTRQQDFQVETNRWIKCQMMLSSGKFRSYHHHDPPLPFQVIELPYAGEDLSLIVLLPALFEDLAELESRLNEESLRTWLNLLQESKIDVVFPKFRVWSDFNLEKTLVAMGMPDAFNGDADFSGIDGTTDGYISFLRHAAFVEVDEEGTTAAAATVTHHRTKSMSPRFLADHPFLYLIRDNRSGSILFLGRLINPTGE